MEGRVKRDMDYRKKLVLFSSANLFIQPFHMAIKWISKRQGGHV